MGWAIPSLEDMMSRAFPISIIVLLVAGVVFRAILLLFISRLKKNHYRNVVTGIVIGLLITFILLLSDASSFLRIEYLLMIVLVDIYVMSTIFILLSAADLLIVSRLIYKILIVIIFIGVIYFVSPRIDTWTDTRVINYENQNNQVQFDLNKKAIVSETVCACAGVRFDLRWISYSPINPGPGYRNGHFCNGFPYACKTTSRIIENYIDISPML